MPESCEKHPPPIEKSDVYQVLTSLVMHSEQIRWARLNTFLVLSSLFVAAWVGVLAGTNDFPCKAFLLFVLCLPGVFLGVLWSRLGWRSSQYMDDFHDKAHKMEEEFPEEMPRPFHLSEDRRKRVGEGAMERYTSSKWIVAAVPALFFILFLALATLSFIL